MSIAFYIALASTVFAIASCAYCYVIIGKFEGVTGLSKGALRRRFAKTVAAILLSIIVTIIIRFTM
jgi:hypothetical protein